MADILIRGMEMPKGNPKEPTAVWIYPNGYVRVFAERGNNVHSAEAISLPEGHGRLGDLDEMMEYIKNHEYELKSRMGCVDKGMFTYQILEYANNHTIVPAEGGTDDV